MSPGTNDLAKETIMHIHVLEPQGNEYVQLEAYQDLIEQKYAIEGICLEKKSNFPMIVKFGRPMHVNCDYIFFCVNRTFRKLNQDCVLLRPNF